MKALENVKGFLRTGMGQTTLIAAAFLLVLIIAAIGLEYKMRTVKTKVVAAPTVVTTVENFGNESRPVHATINAPAAPVTVAQQAPQERPRPLPMSLYTSAAAPLSDRYAAYGRMIKCELINTIDSSKLKTPIIGRVTDDVVWQDKVIIPAGTEVHGYAQVDKTRDRVGTNNDWLFVWNDLSSADNGLELKVSGEGLAQLPRDGGGWAIDDMSAGLPGYVIKTDNLAEIKLFAATLIQGVAAGFSQQTTTSTPYGVSTFNTGSIRDGLTAGVGAVANQYAQQILEQIRTDGFYVQVPAGSTFYIHATQTIDLANGRIGLMREEQATTAAAQNPYPLHQP